MIEPFSYHLEMTWKTRSPFNTLSWVHPSSSSSSGAGPRRSRVCSQFRGVSREPIAGLPGDSLQSSCLDRVVIAHFADHRHRTTEELKRATGRSCHDLILS